MAGRQLCISFTVEKKTLLTPTPAGAEYLIMTKDGSQCQGKFKFDGKIDAPASTEASVKAEPGLEMTETQMPLDLPVKDEPMDANPADDSGFIEGQSDDNNNHLIVNEVQPTAEVGDESHEVAAEMDPVKPEPMDSASAVSGNSAAVIAATDGSGKFSCSVCQKQFASKAGAMKHHKIQHTNLQMSV
ncbi:uncharacterized protein LOC142337054 [Convolutriloba macropyga]|uniref:uncharacterized protein LOC142337054 n=1 Tax=Convolutriloba macropyga TaxID=536237 RepID=UPI003F525C5B